MRNTQIWVQCLTNSIIINNDEFNQTKLLAQTISLNLTISVILLLLLSSKFNNL